MGDRRRSFCVTPCCQCDRPQMSTPSVDPQQQKISDLELLNFSNERRIQELQRMLAKCKDEKHRLKEAKTSLSDELDAVKRELQALRAKESEIEALQKQINQLKAQLAAASGQKEYVEVIKEVEVTKVEKDVTALALLEASYKELQDAYNKLKVENAALEHELEIFGPEARPHRRYDWIDCPIKTVRQGSTMTGYLSKAGKSRRGAWKRRFFILNQDCLFWYHADDSLQTKAKYLRLAGGHIHVHKEATLAHKTDGVKVLRHPFPFRFESDIKDEEGNPIIVVFNAENEKERTEWVVALREAIDKANKYVEAQPPSPRAGGGLAVPGGRRERGKSLVSQLALAAASEEAKKGDKKK